MIQHGQSTYFISVAATATQELLIGWHQTQSRQLHHDVACCARWFLWSLRFPWPTAVADEVTVWGVQQRPYVRLKKLTLVNWFSAGPSPLLARPCLQWTYSCGRGGLHMIQNGQLRCFSCPMAIEELLISWRAKLSLQLHHDLACCTRCFPRSLRSLRFPWPAKDEATVWAVRQWHLIFAKIHIYTLWHWFSVTLSSHVEKEGDGTAWWKVQRLEGVLTLKFLICSGATTTRASGEGKGLGEVAWTTMETNKERVEWQLVQQFGTYVCSPPQWPLRWPFATGEGDGPLPC